MDVSWYIPGHGFVEDHRAAPEELAEIEEDDIPASQASAATQALPRPISLLASHKAPDR